MRRKKVWRYYCDYCKKANCSGASIKKHEERCTMNPNRVCGFCHLLEQKQTNLVEAMQLLPEPKDYIKEEVLGSLIFTSYNGLDEAAEAIMPKLRDFTGNCPACILAALRQKEISLWITSFDFQKESKEIWAEFNKKQSEEDEMQLLGE